ncbi:MAG: hypothetical protein MUF81_19785 [Verrucomicrobia bacterium]|nr:hypothetical protein [Verrucomicrobiota bacterium]
MIYAAKYAKGQLFRGVGLSGVLANGAVRLVHPTKYELTMPQNHINSPENSMLVRRIRLALGDLELERGRLHISVARESKWEKSPSGSNVLVRWLCWSVEDGGKEVLPPSFEVLSDTVTQEMLASELPKVFGEIEVVVDDNIEV